MTARVLLNVATDGSPALLQVEKPEKWGNYSKTKKDKRKQSNLSFLDDFDRFVPWTATYFLDVCAGVSLKLTSSGSFRDKQFYEAIILKQNEGVRPK